MRREKELSRKEEKPSHREDNRRLLGEERPEKLSCIGAGELPAYCFCANSLKVCAMPYPSA